MCRRKGKKHAVQKDIKLQSLLFSAAPAFKGCTPHTLVQHISLLNKNKKRVFNVTVLNQTTTQWPRKHLDKLEQKYNINEHSITKHVKQMSNSLTRQPLKQRDKVSFTF